MTTTSLLLVFQAQRNNEDVDAIQPLFSVNVDHRVSCLSSLQEVIRKSNCTDLKLGGGGICFYLDKAPELAIGTRDGGHLQFYNHFY